MFSIASPYESLVCCFKWFGRSPSVQRLVVVLEIELGFQLHFVNQHDPVECMVPNTHISTLLSHE
jgi:hypothetical protein